MLRSRHRHRSSAWGQPGWKFALGVLLIAFGATIPLGSAGFMASRLVAALAWTAGVVGILWPHPRDGAGQHPARLAAAAAMVLAGWCIWQLCPLPEGWVGKIWRGDPALLQQILADSSVLSIALEWFVSFHTLLLWAGLGVLAWACSRQLRGRPAVPTAMYGLMSLGVFQSVLGIFFMKAHGGRICGTFGSPDALGGLLAMTLPLTLGLVFFRSGQPVLRGRTGFRWWFHRLGTDWRAWLRPVLWTALGIQWTALLFTGSVGATLASGAACGILLIWQGKEVPESRGLLAALGAVLLVLMVVFSIHARSRNVLDRALGDSGELQRSQASRIEIWRAAARLCQAFPWGTGPGGTALALPMYQSGVHGRSRLDYAHNDTLQFLGDLGPVGFGALALLLGMVLWRGGKACLQISDRESSFVWLQRGAWLAAIAALLHAQVEFNLSARPGLQVMFAILCGILWGSKAGRAPRHAESSAPVPSGRRIHFLAAVFLLMGGVAVSLSLAAAWGWRLHEGAVSAVGLAPDEYLWFSRPVLAPGEALDALRRATRLAPGSSQMRQTSAAGRLALHLQQVQQAARSLLPPPEAGMSADALSDSLVPANSQESELAGVALRLEEVEMLHAALDDAHSAVQLAPWDAMPRLIRGKILMRGAVLKQFGEDAEVRARRDLEIAARLYPLDADVLAQACSALSRGPSRAQNLDNLLAWGSQALALDASQAWTVLDAWWAGSVPVSRILELSQMPVSVLWRLYTLLDTQNRTEDARQCLAALENRLAEDRPPEASSLWTPSMWKMWKIQQTQFRIRLASEWLKRSLRNGDWEGVEAWATLRAQARHDRFQVELDKMELAGTASKVLRRLRLREWEAGGGLTPEWTMEWVLLELDASLPARQLQDPLAEMILMKEGILPENLARLQARRVTLADAPLLAALLAAKEAEGAGQPEEAASALASLMDADAVPGRFVHRVWLWQAELLRQAGLTEAAMNAVREAAQACPSDPDVQTALAALGEGDRENLMRDVPRLDLGFLGGRLVLMQACVEQARASTQGATLNLLWRFRGGDLPPDLQMDTRIRDGDGRLLARKTARVDQEVSARFNRGNPPMGSTWLWTIPLSPQAEAGRMATVILLSKAKRLPSDDGLATLELNMEKLPRVKPANAWPTVEKKDE